MAIVLSRKPGAGGGSSPPAGATFLEVYSSEPADGTLSAGEIVAWYDDNDVTPALNFKAKTADGTLATMQMPLEPS